MSLRTTAISAIVDGSRTQNAGTSFKAGKHKIPRYIYHLTTQNNYKKMLKSGKIAKSLDGLFGMGICATELTNLFKRWGKNKDWHNISLQKKLIEQIRESGQDIVILKIPTKNLNHDKLKIRSQNRLFKWTFNPKTARYIQLLEHSLNERFASSPINEDYLKALREGVNNVFQKCETKDRDHIISGSPARESALFKQRKEAIEYVYLDEISINAVEKIGQVNLVKLGKNKDYDPEKPMRSFFTALLKGTPEAKGAELLKY